MANRSTCVWISASVLCPAEIISFSFCLCSVTPGKKHVWNWLSYLEEEKMAPAPLKLFKEVDSSWIIYLFCSCEYLMTLCIWLMGGAGVVLACAVVRTGKIEFSPCQTSLEFLHTKEFSYRKEPDRVDFLYFVLLQHRIKG